MTIVTTTTTTTTTTTRPSTTLPLDLGGQRSSIHIVATSENKVSKIPQVGAPSTTTMSSIPRLSLNKVGDCIIDALCISTLYLIHFVYIAYIAKETLCTYIIHQWQQYRQQQQQQQKQQLLLQDDLSALSQAQTPLGKQQMFLSMLDSDKSQLTKIPRHLAVTLSSELVFERTEEDWNTIVADICQASCWAWEMGIKELSVFDASGVLKNMAVNVYKQQSATLHEWKQKRHQGQSTSSTIENDFRFIILSLEDSRSQLIQTTQKVYRHVTFNETKASSIDINLVNEFMHEDLSDPDLMIVYDGLPHHYVSIDGYSPWHIRLTEFINATSYHRLDYTLFSSSLYRYSKVEQRFGH